MSFWKIIFVIVAGTTVMTKAAVPITNDVTVTVDKAQYAAFQYITCSISGMNKNQYLISIFNNSVNEYEKKRDSVRIVTSNDLFNASSIQNLIDQSKYSTFNRRTTLFHNISSDNDKINITLEMENLKIIGPVFQDRYTWDDDSSRLYDNGYTKITILNNKMNSGPYYCIVVNTETQKVVGVSSKSFTIGSPNPVTITVDKMTYLPGQTILASISSQNKSMFDESSIGDYLRLYKVPYDVSTNPLLLNTIGGNATYVKTINLDYPTKFSAIEQLIDWKTPGKYQLVLLSDYMQIVRGISNVFVVQTLTRNKNTTITFNNGTITPTGKNTTTRSIYPGQSIQMTIYHPNDPPVGSKIVTAFIKAQDNVNVYVNGTKEWIAMSTNTLTWDSTTTTNLTITSARFSRVDSGYYKVVVQAGGYVVAVSKAILVKQPFIQIPLPKTKYYQWEPIPFQNYINNPYFTPYVHEKNHIYFYEILPLNYTVPINTSISYSSRQQFGLTLEKNDEYNRNTNVNTLRPGLYNIRLLVYRSEWSYHYEYQSYTLEKVVPIKNTTFRVLQNYAKFVIDNYKSLYKYNDYIDYTFDTKEDFTFGGHIHLFASLIKYQYSIHIQTIDLNSHDNTTNNRTKLHGTMKIENTYLGCSEFNLFLTGDTKFLKEFSQYTFVLDQQMDPEFCTL